MIPQERFRTSATLDNRGAIDSALMLRAQGRPEEALRLLYGPGEFSRDLYNLRGDLQLELGQIQEAVGSYSTVISFEADNTYAYDNLALCLRKLKHWKAAAEVFRKLLSYDSHRDQARIGLADCLLHLNRPEEALACFDMCWSEAAQVPALFGKAVALQLLCRFDEAEAIYERLLELDPKAEEAFSNLIAMGIEVFDLVRVQRYSLRLLELCPQSKIALQGLTVVAVERLEYENAGHYFARLIALEHDGILSNDESGGDNGGTTEYVLSPEVLERLNQTRRNVFTSAAKAAGMGTR
jgi:tetratricopeptide (TPR) repeat protein